MYSFKELLEITERALAQMPYPKEPQQLYEPIRYTLEAGGKRIRPVMALMACNLFREGINDAKSAALAIEVFHNFTLLHDDIMDNADVRRGKPAVHTRWNDNVAILSGDAMMIYAYKLLSQCEEAVMPRVLNVFNEVAMGVCEGQQYDMNFEERGEVSVKEYLEMIRLKTAVLLAGALKIGAICGHAGEPQTEILYKYGIAVGLAFQLQDDLFDTYGDEAVFGKPIGGDILEGKKTFLLTNALQAADAPVKERLLALLGDKTMEPERKIGEVRKIYDALGVRESTEKAVAAYFDEARLLLHSLPVPAERLEPIRELTDLLLNRKK